MTLKLCGNCGKGYESDPTAVEATFEELTVGDETTGMIELYDDGNGRMAIGGGWMDLCQYCVSLAPNVLATAR
jgi:hypothetical protein